jgi:hypothetical protein
VARLTPAGATPLAWRLRSDADRLEEDARAIAAELAGTWIDKIELDCATPPAVGAAASPDPIAELRALMETEVTQSKAYQDALREFADELSRHLPHGSRDGLLGRDAQEFGDILRGIASEGADEVLAHLRAADRDLAA